MGYKRTLQKLAEHTNDAIARALIEQLARDLEEKFNNVRNEIGGIIGNIEFNLTVAIDDLKTTVATLNEAAGQSNTTLNSEIANVVAKANELAVHIATLAARVQELTDNDARTVNDE